MRLLRGGKQGLGSRTSRVDSVQSDSDKVTVCSSRVGNREELDVRIGVVVAALDEITVVDECVHIAH